MALYQVTSKSKSIRAVVLGDTLAEIISESITELSLPHNQYKIVLEETGAVISNIKILEKWAEKYTSPPQLMIVPKNESAPPEELSPMSQAEQALAQSSVPLAIATDGMRDVEPNSTDDLVVNQTETRSNVGEPRASTSAESEIMRSHQRREPSNFPSWSWSELPRHIMDKCKERKRASKCERDLVINLISMYLMNDLKDTSHATIRTMARDICQLYPATFADRFGDQVLGTQSDVFARQLSRSVGYRKHLEKPSVVDDQAAATKRGQKRKRADSITLDSHGCALWEPPLPPGETAETQLTAQEFLEEKAKATDAEEPEIFNALKRSYASQRIQMNRRGGLIVDVLAKWSILKESKYFLWHATQLLGKNVDDEFRRKLDANDAIYRYINYYQIERCNSETEQLKKIRKTLKASASAVEHLGNDDCKQLAIIPLLTEYFKEDTDLLYLVMDSATALKDMEAALSATTPTLIVLGRSLYDRAASCKIFIEKKACVDVDNVLQGFLVVFLAYFVFGLKYPKQLKSTLEFIQRVFLDINPEKGRKQVEGPGRQRTLIDSKCNTLSENLATFREKDVGI